ncbi:zinc-dependent metalloprotease [Vibrio alginolyticus]|uniref:M12 family metallo-peptidase n=1 Tax=Vibrio alginolyticus TaxID=663 RepID=UPI001EEC96DE|nr:M12 family metallo-peptidase [Vibrio alginolyticus]MCG6316724.1 zinc-dependent metalloprotease [Vibrio alginolyticus]
MKKLLFTTLSLILGFSSVSAEEKMSLFIHSSNHQDLTPKQEKVLEYIRSQKMNSNVKTVEINARAFSAPSFLLNVSPNDSFSANTKSFDSVRETKQWLGGLADSPGSASFVIRGENVTGTIQNTDHMYSIKPIGGGLHAIIEQNPLNFPDEHPPEYDQQEKKAIEEVEQSPTKVNLIDGDNESSDTRLDRNIDEITVLVAYTTAVVNVVADPQGLIELAVKETNESYANSNIAAKVTLVGSKKVNYSESGNFRTDLNRLSNKSDGVMDDIHSLRNSTKADIVVLLINEGDYCGLADDIMASEDSAFAVVFHECATGYYSFGHEIGHLQGARHNREADSSTSPFKYGHGYYLKNDHVRTVMSYDCQEGCRRLPYWSNPEVSYNGKAFGTKEKNNNSRVLVETLPRVSRFR